jgi:hypothetical protein
MPVANATVALVHTGQCAGMPSLAAVLQAETTRRGRPSFRRPDENAVPVRGRAGVERGGTIGHDLCW